MKKEKKERQKVFEAYTDSGNVLSTKHSTASLCLIEDESLISEFRRYALNQLVP